MSVEKITVAWRIELDCECPYCEFGFDLMDYIFEPGEKGRCELAEHGTDNTRGMEFECPDCDGLFTVDLEW